MNLEQIYEKLAILIPEQKEKIKRNINENDGKLLGHIYFEDEFNIDLINLLTKYNEIEKIKKYCNFIEYMWKNGNKYIINIIDVTILERLSDNNIIWHRFGKNISDEFKYYINNEVIPNNIMMKHVSKL